MPYEPPTHREYMQAMQAANDPIVENGHLRRRNGELEQRLEAVELTSERSADIGSSDLTRLAHHYHALLTEIIGVRRRGHFMKRQLRLILKVQLRGKTWVLHGSGCTTTRGHVLHVSEPWR
jgi:hypothetical protein